MGLDSNIAMRLRNQFLRLKSQPPFRFFRNEEGSLVVESAMVMPLVLLFTIALLAAPVIAYLRTETIVRTFEWTERAAYVWKDSNKDPVTGAFSYVEMDDVYASMISEGLGWLGAAFRGFRQAEIQLPDQTLSGQKLPKAKLLRSAYPLDEAVTGTGSYYNRALEGEIRAVWNPALTTQSANANFFRVGGKDVQASAYYSDPVEFLRNVDLVVTYASKLKERFSSPKTASEKIASVLPQQPDKPKIESAEQATLYLQKLMASSGAKMNVPLGKRIIDVLDSDGYAHDAKYTMNSTDYKKQIAKDAELIKSGKVKGVVWHFFYMEDKKKYSASKPMLKMLEENGIMVVYHR